MSRPAGLIYEDALRAYWAIGLIRLLILVSSVAHPGPISSHTVYCAPDQVGYTVVTNPNREEHAMPKVFGIREIELRPDVDPNEYERFCREELMPQMSLDGWRIHLLRGDRGSREGRFAWLFEIESTDARDRYFPGHDQLSDEMARWFEQHPEAWAALQPGNFVQAEDDTDYLDISS